MAQPTCRQDDVHPKRVEGAVVVESPRRLPIRSDVDVLVCGGGPAGVGAALMAAAEGASVMLIEQYGMLGGVWTAGLLNPFFECMGRGGVVEGLVDRLRDAHSLRPWMKTYTFDVETMRRILDDMAADTGLTVLYYTRVVDAIVEGDRLRGVVIESKAGREAITAKVVIDTTGDGDVAARAGCPYELGRLADGHLQPMTLMFEVGGLGDFQHNDARLLYDAMQQAMRENDLAVDLPFGRVGYAPWIINTPVPGYGAVQATHVYRLNPLDPADLTRGTIDCRQQAARITEVLRHVPGLADIRITHSAAQIGVREARRIRGKHYLTIDDLKNGRRFDDAIAACAFVVDIHDPDPGSGVESGHTHAIKPYEIPYRCCVPERVRGLLTAGRCISGSHEAHASYRVTGTAMGIGQGTGLAAAWACAESIDPSTVPGEKLKHTLIARGAAMADSAIASV